MNYYAIILVLVSLGGIGVTLWGWKILRVSRKISQWPTVAGVIKKSDLGRPEDAFSLDIQYAYSIDAKEYQRDFELPGDVELMPELCVAYSEKYPVGKKVMIYYDASNPSNSLLEPSLRGDWMVLVLGIIMAVAGVVALLS